METKLKSTEADLRTALVTQEDMKEEKRCAQQQLDTVTAQYTQEKADHKLTQEKLDTLKSQVNDARRSKVRKKADWLRISVNI